MFINQPRRLISVRVLLQRFSTQSTLPVDVESKMKKLLGARQYGDALALFDQQSGRFTDASLCLALEASTKLMDRARGIRIHRQLSKRATTDPRNQNALIRFYSRIRDLPDSLNLTIQHYCYF